MIKSTAKFNTPSMRAALTGIMCALAVAVSFAEGILLAVPLPGAKPGLSNIVTMAALSWQGVPAAVAVTLTKGLAAFTRGAAAGVMSLSGGLCSILVMTATGKLFKKHISFIGMGVAGAAAHNMAQLTAAMIISGPGLAFLAPLLLIWSAVSGILTGFVMCILERRFYQNAYKKSA